MTEEQESYNVTPQMPEAPASLNIRFSMNQFECLLTLRNFEPDGFSAASKLVSGLPKVLEALYKKGAQPIFGKNGPVTQPTQAKQEESEPDELPKEKPCPIHNVMMKLRTGQGGHWYSHKLADGTWCKGE